MTTGSDKAGLRRDHETDGHPQMLPHATRLITPTRKRSRTNMDSLPSHPPANFSGQRRKWVLIRMVRTLTTNKANIMSDPRLNKLANILIHHSIKIEPGEVVLIESIDAPHEMVIALIQAIRDCWSYSNR